MSRYRLSDHIERDLADRDRYADGYREGYEDGYREALATAPGYTEARRRLAAALGLFCCLLALFCALVGWAGWEAMK